MSLRRRLDSDEQSTERVPDAERTKCEHGYWVDPEPEWEPDGGGGGQWVYPPRTFVWAWEDIDILSGWCTHCGVKFHYSGGT